MGEYTVEEEVGVGADRLWEVIADFGNVPWIPGVSQVEVEGEGPGMVRIMDGQVREQLETLDPATRTLTYTIPGLPLPMQNYHSTMRVQPAGEGRCRLAWTCRADPDGASEAEVEQIITGLYRSMIGRAPRAPGRSLRKRAWTTSLGASGIARQRTST